MSYSFKFLDPVLQAKFRQLLDEASVDHEVTPDDVVQYAEQDEQRVENEILSEIRTSIFPEWQIISCPSDGAAEYKRHMLEQKVPFVEELIDGQLGFLVPRSYLPHTWELRDPPRRIVS